MSKKDLPKVTGSKLSGSIDAILGSLASSEQEEIARRSQKMGALHQQWAEAFNSVSTAFLDLWDVLGEIEQRLVSWRRVARAEGQEGKWGPISLSRRGYAFSAGLVQGEDPMATKWLIVSFAHGAAGSDGMGDERVFGVNGQPKDRLIGWQGETKGLDSYKLEQAESLVTRVSGLSYIFDIHHNLLGQRRFSVPRDRFKDRTLGEISAMLFVALNNDELEKMRVLEASLNPALLE